VVALISQTPTAFHHVSYNPTVDTLHAGPDSRGSTLTELEPPPNEFRVLAVELSEISPEIPETQAIALENIRREQDDHSNDGKYSLSFMLILVKESV
jgi:hypothetical protein